MLVLVISEVIAMLFCAGIMYCCILVGKHSAEEEKRLRHRYDCLKAAMDILRDENTGYLQMIKQIEEMYEKANEESNGFRYEWRKSARELDRILENLPQEAWIQ